MLGRFERLGAAATIAASLLFATPAHRPIVAQEQKELEFKADQTHPFDIYRRGPNSHEIDPRFDKENINIFDRRTQGVIFFAHNCYVTDITMRTTSAVMQTDESVKPCLAPGTISEPPTGIEPVLVYEGVPVKFVGGNVFLGDPSGIPLANIASRNKVENLFMERCVLNGMGHSGDAVFIVVKDPASCKEAIMKERVVYSLPLAA